MLPRTTFFNISVYAQRNSAKYTGLMRHKLEICLH